MSDYFGQNLRGLYFLPWGRGAKVIGALRGGLIGGQQGGAKLVQGGGRLTLVKKHNKVTFSGLLSMNTLAL